MIRVVLDTNVIVSALLVPNGTQASVLLLALRGNVSLVVSSAILSGYESVLRRSRFKLAPSRVDAALDAIRAVAELVL